MKSNTILKEQINTMETLNEKRCTMEDWFKIPESSHVEMIDGILYEKETGRRVTLEEAMIDRTIRHADDTAETSSVHPESAGEPKGSHGRHTELIDGVIYDMAAPSRKHQELVTQFIIKISNYIDSKGGNCKVYPAPFDVYLFENEETVFQPDISVICDRNKLTDRGCTGAPDWIIEIVSPGNPRHDYIEKLDMYMRARVREYWIVNPENRSVIVYAGKNPYIPSIFTFEDVIKAGIYEDLSIDFKEIMARIEG